VVGPFRYLIVTTIERSCPLLARDILNLNLPVKSGQRRDQVVGGG